MPVPQELGDLPYAQYLEPHDGELTPEGDYTAGRSRPVETPHDC